MKVKLANPKLLFILLVFISNAGFSQLRKGHFIIEPYYGGPNYGALVGKIAVNSLQGIIEDFVYEEENFQISASSDISVKGMGPFGGRAEYIIVDRLGVGIDFIYNSATANFAVDSLNVQVDPVEVVESFNLTYTMRRIRVLARANYHFVNTKMWDVYCTLGIGYNNRIHTLDGEGVFDWDFSRSFTFAYPIAARTGIGVRFYPVKWVGLGLELGLGGPTVSGGLSARFNPFGKDESHGRMN